MSILKLLSWNMNQKAANWQAVLDSGVDVAMLQEAKAPPADLADNFTFQQNLESAERKLSWRAIVAGLVNTDKLDFTPIKTQPLNGSDPEALIVSSAGSLDAAFIRIRETGEEIIAVSLYSSWLSPGLKNCRRIA